MTRRIVASLATREQVAMALDAIGASDETEIDYLLETELPELLNRLGNLPDPMEIWRTLSSATGLDEDSLGVYWSWDKAGAIEHAHSELGDVGITLLHGEVEKHHVDWPRTFAENLGSYQDEREIFIPRGAPIKLLDVNGEPDGRILPA